MSEPAYAVHADKHGKRVSTRFNRVGRGTAIVFIHGVGMDATVWAPQISAFAGSHDVIALDMLGHGGSSLPPAGAELSDYAGQVRSVLDTCGIEKAHIIGHSMGALVALEFALSDASCVLSVTALNAVFQRNEEQKNSVSVRLAALESATDSVPSDQTIERWFGSPVPEQWKKAETIVRQLLARVNIGGYRDTYLIFASSDDAHSKRLPHLSVPALFLTGELDPNSLPSMSRVMASLAPKGRFDVIQHERHMMGLTAPEIVNERIAAFLTSSEGITDDLKSTDPGSYRKALGNYLTGVTVVATIGCDGEARGFTANSFTSVSLSPPLVSVCINKNSASARSFREAKGFSVNVLSENQSDVSTIFATRDTDRFAKVAWQKGPSGNPVLDGVTAWFDCRQHTVIDAGDHFILIGEVEGFGKAPFNPLGYCRGAHIKFALPITSDGKGSQTRVSVGVILESDERVLFVADQNKHITLPSTKSPSAERSQAGLADLLAKLGVDAEINFLYAVIDDAASQSTSIFYRGRLLAATASDERIQLVRLEDIPSLKIADQAIASMLDRYVKERREDQFGIYVGTAHQGIVRSLTASPQEG
ncbi:MAG: alpha/beta fold hydrolase [Hyphomicrobium sp.]|uniref:alpha/beta fold hydrolase n=1 Tax=Hyphomicrobium sp. TaxID=82 RepID=UPI0039E70728